MLPWKLSDQSKRMSVQGYLWNSRGRCPGYKKHIKPIHFRISAIPACTAKQRHHQMWRYKRLWIAERFFVLICITIFQDMRYSKYTQLLSTFTVTTVNAQTCPIVTNILTYLLVLRAGRLLIWMYMKKIQLVIVLS